MILTILRTAFLAYVRVLLCLQGIYLGFWVWVLWPDREPHTKFWAPLGIALLFAFLGLAGIVAALLFRRGQRWAAGAALFLVAVVGLLLLPVRAYAGLVRR